ncbi:hypothetical protein ACFHW1_04930 [Micromonospora sp. LOL_014]|uniref:phage tail tube protein n=1 Tax=Micromonospora sp. LOL_014 TaxID=3345415 RepID=UPI003A89247A
MADVFADGNVRVAFVASIANIAAPTVAELNAGILLQSTLTADGLVGYEATTAEVDTTSLASTFDTKNIGRDAYSGTMLRLKKQTVGADTIRSTLTRATTGHIVIRRGIAETTAWAASQQVEVYPIICGRRKELAPEANTVMRYEVPTMVSAPPEPDAVVAA